MKFLILSCISVFFITMDDLATNWNQLTLSDKEGLGCCLDEELSSLEFSIATNFSQKEH